MSFGLPRSMSCSVGPRPEFSWATTSYFRNLIGFGERHTVGESWLDHLYARSVALSPFSRLCETCNSLLVSESTGTRSLALSLFLAGKVTCSLLCPTKQTFRVAGRVQMNQVL